MKNAAKTMSTHAFTQFELTTNLLRNLYKYDLTPVTKLVLLELTTHINESTNGFVVFPSVNYIAEVLGIGLTATKKAINDLIKEGLIIKSKRSKVRGNYNKYLLTPKVQISTSERAENECFKKTDNALFFNEQKKETNKPTNVDNFKILKEYAIKHNAYNIPAYIKWLQKTGSDKQIIKEHKQAEINSKALYKISQQHIKDLEYAKQNAWVVPEGYFEQIRNKLKTPSAP